MDRREKQIPNYSNTERFVVFVRAAMVSSLISDAAASDKRYAFAGRTLTLWLSNRLRDRNRAARRPAPEGRGAAGGLTFRGWRLQKRQVRLRG